MLENINRALSSIHQIVLGKKQQVKLALCWQVVIFYPRIDSAGQNYLSAAVSRRSWLIVQARSIHQ